MSFYHDQPLISPEAFQELVRERTAERKLITKTKRQNGLRRIEEMWSTSGDDPLELFPKEIWMDILENANPADRGNALKVHPVFAGIMEDIRIRDILFPQVVPVLLTYLKNNSSESDTLGWRVSYDNSPRNAKLSIPIVKLREVSKSLRLAVDNWFEENIQKELDQPDMDWKKLPRVILYHISRNRTLLDGLIENYNAAAVSPDEYSCDRPLVKSYKAFFLRSIEVYFSLGRDSEIWISQLHRHNLRRDAYLPFESKMAKLLKVIGDQILFFKLHVDSIYTYSYAFENFYFTLRKFCLLMPNIRRLDIFFDLPERDRTLHHTVSPAMAPLFNMCRFPKLRKLESVCFTQNTNIFFAAVVYDAILMTNPQVKMLRLGMEDKVLETMSQETLKSLNLKLFSWHSPAQYSSLKSDSLLSRMSHWPLKTLEIWPKYQNLNYVFRLLEKFPKLDKVMLHMVDSGIWIGSGMQFLKLPNLTHFEFELNGKLDLDTDDVNFLFSLQFLLYAKKLKRLRLRWCYNAMGMETLRRYLKDHECPEKMLDFRGGWRDMNSSNVWKMFPQLEIVDIKLCQRGSSWNTVSRPRAEEETFVQFQRRKSV